MQGTRLPWLDLLRFLAALAVMLFHLAHWSWVAPDGTPGSILQGRVQFPELTYLSWWGWVGVEIFFVISGYVIAFSAAKATAMTFARSRFLRLFPGALVCATITLAVAVLIGWRPLQSLIMQYFKSITFWPFGGWIDGVYWTLGVELTFYGIVWLLLVFRRLAWLEAVISTIGIATGLAAIGWFVFVSQSTVIGLFGIPYRYVDLALVRHGMYFCLGVILYLAATSGWTSERICTAIICVIAGVLLVFARGNARSLAFELGPVQWVPVIVWLMGVALVWRSHRLRMTPTVAKVVSVLGIATYPLYLVHTVVGSALMRTLLDAGVERFSSLALTITSMIALAIALTLTVERHLRSLLAGFWRVPGSNTASAAISRTSSRA